jgi:hypothetical protein
MFQGIELFFVLAAVVGGPLLAVMIVPALARRFLRTTAPTEHPPAAELDDLTRRVAELEERLDFAERLLARQSEVKR